MDLMEQLKKAIEVQFELEHRLIEDSERLEKENAILRTALKAVEWVDVGGLFHVCPWCHQYRNHALDCERQVALGCEK